jgi:hypothetical protein
VRIRYACARNAPDGAAAGRSAQTLEVVCLAPRRNRISEALATARGASVLVGLFGSPFLVFGAISLSATIRGEAMGAFAIGQAIPLKFMAPSATNLNVLFFCAAGFFAVLVAVVLRYRQHRNMVEFIRSRGVTDYNLDGKRDSFADRFLDDL